MPWSEVNGERTVPDVARHERGETQLCYALEIRTLPAAFKRAARSRTLNQE